MFRGAIHQVLFCQNVLKGNSSKFNDVKLSRYTVVLLVANYNHYFSMHAILVRSFH